MGCFGNLCASGASVKPKKRYNLLVPAIFPSSAPLWTSPLDPATARSIDSLQEYVEENVQRSPKVSRRLWRRICTDHAKSKELGIIKIAVHGYIALLNHAKAGDSALFEKEVATNEKAAIPMLIAYTGEAVEDQARCVLGLELLAHFLRAQNSSENAQLLAQYTDVAQQLLNPGASYAERNGASLRVMREYVTFARNQTIPCQHLDAIEQQSLDWLDKAREQPGDRALDVQYVHRLGLHAKYTTSDPCELAHEVMQELLKMSPDVTVGEQVIGNALNHISTNRAWRDEAKQEHTMHILRSGCIEADSHILLLSGLYRLLSDSNLHPEDVPAVLKAAAHDAPALPDALAAPALARALTATAPLLPATDAPLSTDPSSVEAHVGECMRSLVWKRQDPVLLLESLAATLEVSSTEAPEPATRRMRAAHLAIRGLAAEGSAHIDYIPGMLLSELARLSTLPSPPPADPSAHLLLQAAAVNAATDVVTLSSAPLKAAPVAQLQDALALQLDPKLPHSPAQLTATSRLFASMLPRTPDALVSRSSALALSSARAVVAAPQEAQASLEVLRTCEHCCRQLCAYAEVASPWTLPMEACTTLAVDPHSQALVLTGTAPQPEHAQAALSHMVESEAVNKYTQIVAKALATSPKLAAIGLNGTADMYLEFTATKDEESVMSDERTTTSSTGPSGHTSALAAAAAPQAVDKPRENGDAESDVHAFLALPPPQVSPASPTGVLLQDSHDARSALLPGNSGVVGDAALGSKQTAEGTAVLLGQTGRLTGSAGAGLQGPAVDIQESHLPKSVFESQAGHVGLPGSEESQPELQGETARLPFPLMSMSRIPTSPPRPLTDSEAAMAGPGSVPYPPASGTNVYTPADGGSPSAAERPKARALHAQVASPSKPPLGPSISAMSEGASWSPPPAVVTRSVHALPPRPSRDGVPGSPTSSVGNLSTWSRSGYSRSIHAVPRFPPGAEASDSIMGGGPRSPSGHSVSASVTSSVRRRIRTSLHVLPRRASGAAETTAFSRILHNNSEQAAVAPM